MAIEVEQPLRAACAREGIPVSNAAGAYARHGVDLGTRKREPLGQSVGHTVDCLLLPAYKLERRCARTGPPHRVSLRTRAAMFCGHAKAGAPGERAFRVRAANKIAAALDNISMR